MEDREGTSSGKTSGPGSDLETEDETPAWRRGWIQFRYEPSGVSLKRATRSIFVISLLVPLFALAALLYHPHLRSAPALAACLVLFCCVTTFNICELKAQKEARFDWFRPNRSILASTSSIVEFGLFGLAFGIHGGAFLLMPCTVFLVAVLLGNLTMIAVAWAVLVTTLGFETGLQVPALDAVWLTVLFGGAAAIVGVFTDRALTGSLYSLGRNQSLAVLASHAGTLQSWPDDLGPIAGRLAQALDIDRYSILAGQDGELRPVLSWPDPVWPDPGQLGDLPGRAVITAGWVSNGDLVATPSSVGEIDIVLVVPAVSVLDVPVDHNLLSTGVALLAAMCDRARLIGGLVDLANTDELTGIANRRCLFNALEDELGRARRSRRVFSVAILDLDHFKQYNDRHGHSAGDSLLRTFSAGVAERIRAQDLLARYGGEEFCLVLPETDAEGALGLVDAVRRQMTSEGEGDGITFSAGVAAWDGTESIDSLILRADANLYVAKTNGRNRVVNVP